MNEKNIKKLLFTRNKNVTKKQNINKMYWIHYTDLNQKKRMTITSNQHKLVVSHKVERLHIAGTIRRLCIHGLNTYRKLI